MKSFTIISAIFFATFFLSNCAQTEKTEAITAEITAAQMEGRREAGRILGPHWKDTLQLQRALLEAKAKQSKYLIEGKGHCAEAFDSSFVSTIRTVNPDLAKKIIQ
ncbi:MAG: hypothetical protein J1F12_06735 [Muribaculaceae bacterium]|nr:hypothetical protein [Muribaculaceae bacterium]